MASNAQNLRLRRPDTSAPAPKPARHTGILQDQLRRSAKRIWSPSFSLAVRILLLVRITGAMYSVIQDCDEVFNFWEPLHYLDRGTGFQTWEVSPAYAIRSWAYILLHLVPARIPAVLLGPDKRPAFFAVRIALGLVSTLCEVRFYRTVAVKINERVGRYLFFMLMLSAGMWNASTAFLPSSFAMYASTLAFSYAFEPPSARNGYRTLISTVLFAAGAVVGWPFALALAIPFVLEELLVRGADRVASSAWQTWIVARWTRLITAGLAAALIFIPVVGIDSLAYGRLVVVPWNIVSYNIFGGAERGPDLYGTEPWNFYILNLVLNFNLLVPLALFSLPVLAATYAFDRKRLGLVRPGPDESSPFTVLALRLAPFYIWIGILSLQAHKEERFMFPAYPVLCFNAAVTLYLLRGLSEVAYVTWTKSPYKASQSSVFARLTSSAILASSILSASRVLALLLYYHAPKTVIFELENKELPRLLNVTGLLPPVPPHTDPDDLPRIDLSPIKDFGLRLCIGKEWHRFPGSYLVPEGIRIDFVKSEFNGALPGHFVEGAKAESWNGWFRPGTRVVPEGLNDLNHEEPSHYVPVESCDYLIDLDFPNHPIESALEPRYAVDEDTWERVLCTPFLDARHSSMLTRILWMPGEKWQSLNEFGDYCLLKNRASVAAKERRMAAKKN
ncbi:glycosyltransferase family 22 protein [Plicaturopsis crispa FD-325 SS-3]|nr:glycosyltransferase family 22 protein [Plicaturopsis crispa FD-325 SS-3]